MNLSRKVKFYLLLTLAMLLLAATLWYFGIRLFVILSAQFVTIGVVGFAYYDLKKNVVKSHENITTNQKKIHKEVRSLK